MRSAVSLRRKRFEQRLRVHQTTGAVAFRKPSVNRSKQFARFPHLVVPDRLEHERAAVVFDDGVKRLLFGCAAPEPQLGLWPAATAAIASI